MLQFLFWSYRILPLCLYLGRFGCKAGHCQPDWGAGNVK